MFGGIREICRVGIFLPWMVVSGFVLDFCLGGVWGILRRDLELER